MATVVPDANSTNLTVMIDNYDSFTYNIVQYLAELGAQVAVYRNDEITVEDLIALNPTRIIISPGPGCPAEAGISKSVISAFAGKIPILGICLGHQSIIEEFGGEIVRAPHIMHGKMSRMYHDNQGIFYDLHNQLEQFKPPPSISASILKETSEIQKNLEHSFLATRYHSLVGNPSRFPSSLMVTSYCEESEIPSSGENGDGTSAPKIEESKEIVTETITNITYKNTAARRTIMGVRHHEYVIEGVQFHPESVTSEYGKKLLWNFLQQTNGKWD